MTRPDHVIFYTDQAGDWRWQYRRSNGRIMADSAEGYTDLRGAEKAARHLWPLGPLTEYDHRRRAEVTR